MTGLRDCTTRVSEEGGKRTGGFGCAMLNSWHWPIVEATLVGTTRRLRRFANVR